MSKFELVEIMEGSKVNSFWRRWELRANNKTIKIAHAMNGTGPYYLYESWLVLGDTTVEVNGFLAAQAKALELLGVTFDE